MARTLSNEAGKGESMSKPARDVNLVQNSEHNTGQNSRRDRLEGEWNQIYTFPGRVRKEREDVRDGWWWIMEIT